MKSMYRAVAVGVMTAVLGLSAGCAGTRNNEIRREKYWWHRTTRCGCFICTGIVMD